MKQMLTAEAELDEADVDCEAELDNEGTDVDCGSRT